MNKEVKITNAPTAGSGGREYVTVVSAVKSLRVDKTPRVLGNVGTVEHV